MGQCHCDIGSLRRALFQLKIAVGYQADGHFSRY